MARKSKQEELREMLMSMSPEQIEAMRSGAPKATPTKSVKSSTSSAYASLSYDELNAMDAQAKDDLKAAMIDDDMDKIMQISNQRKQIQAELETRRNSVESGGNSRLEGKINELTKGMAELLKANSVMVQQLAESNSEMKNMRSKIESMEISHAQETASLKDEIARLNQLIANLQSGNNGISSDNNNNGNVGKDSGSNPETPDTTEKPKSSRTRKDGVAKKGETKKALDTAMGDLRDRYNDVISKCSGGGTDIDEFVRTYGDTPFDSLPQAVQDKLILEFSKGDDVYNIILSNQDNWISEAQAEAYDEAERDFMEGSPLSEVMEDNINTSEFLNSFEGI